MKAINSLVITPFDVSKQDVYDTIIKALSEVGIDVYRPHELLTGDLIVNTITDAIRKADVIFVDISRQNPNVFYELGIAHALRKPTLLLMSSDANTNLPTDLQGFFYFVYNPKDLSNLSDYVKKSVKKYLHRKGA